MTNTVTQTECLNPWHASAPARAGMSCPECPNKAPKISPAEYNASLLRNQTTAASWTTAKQGNEEYKLRISGKHGITLVDEFWFATSQERTLWLLAHTGDAKNPNAAQAEPRFKMEHILGWSNPEGDETSLIHLETHTCGAFLTPITPGEPALGCKHC